MVCKKKLLCTLHADKKLIAYTPYADKTFNLKMYITDLYGMVAYCCYVGAGVVDDNVLPGSESNARDDQVSQVGVPLPRLPQLLKIFHPLILPSLVARPSLSCPVA